MTKALTNLEDTVKLPALFGPHQYAARPCPGREEFATRCERQSLRAASSGTSRPVERACATGLYDRRDDVLR